MQPEEIQQAEATVNASFLSGRHKQHLIDLAHSGCTLEQWETKFDELLALNVVERGKLYEDTANETDASLKNAGDEYSQARSNLDSWLDQRLGEVDASDFAAREGVFEEYYRAVDALQQKNTSEDKSVATYHS